MQRPTDAIVTGFSKNATLTQASLAPLRALKQMGVLRRVLCVTWDSPEIDAFVAPVAEMSDVELVRLPQPEAKGSIYQRGTVYQVRNLEAALRAIAEDDVLVLKSRPDFVADADFLRAKIEGFDRLCALHEIPVAGVAMPRSPFKAKIWTPWADANQPFFYEDAAFLGLKCDIAKLVTPKIEDKIAVMAPAENLYGPFAHVLRFGSIFRDSWPIFARYLKDYRFFVNDMTYREALVPRMVADPFFLHLAVAHAYVLTTNFHVDAGRQGQLALYPNILNRNADWSSLASLRVNPPFDYVDQWRSSAKAGSYQAGVARLYGRLVDDAWQHRLVADVPSDLKPETVPLLLKAAVHYRTGVLSAFEDRFYNTLASVYREHWLNRAAA
jgi:hypothetical protein